MSFKSFLKGYKQNTGSFYLEEPCDFLFFRPIAYCIVKLTYSLPLTPNHFSFLALIIAMISGYFLSIGSANGFFWGGVGIFIFCVLDCCDGMLARMKKNGSKHGDLIDMLVDILSNLAFFSGLFIGITSKDYFIPLQVLVVISGVLILVHALFYNFYKKMYFYYSQRNPEGMFREVDGLKRDLKLLKNQKGKYFSKCLLAFFIKLSKTQKKDDKITNYDLDKYTEYNKTTLFLWSFISGSSHLALLSFSLMTYRLGIFFFFSIIIFNLWLAFIYIVQTGVNEGLAVVK